MEMLVLLLLMMLMPLAVAGAPLKESVRLPAAAGAWLITSVPLPGLLFRSDGDVGAAAVDDADAAGGGRSAVEGVREIARRRRSVAHHQRAVTGVVVPIGWRCWCCCC